MEGTGTIFVASYTGATYTNFNAVAGDPSANLWQTAGGTGAGDSTLLFTANSVTLADGEIMASDGSGAFAALVESWFAGNNPDGLLIRCPNASYPMLLATVTAGQHTDPYQSIGFLAIFRAKKGTVIELR